MGDLNKRPRCKACGNLTRFSVTWTSRQEAYFHYGLNGTFEVDEQKIVDEKVEEVSCRWCGNGDNIEFIDSTDPSPESSPDKLVGQFMKEA